MRHLLIHIFGIQLKNWIHTARYVLRLVNIPISISSLIFWVVCLWDMVELCCRKRKEANGLNPLL